MLALTVLSLVVFTADEPARPRLAVLGARAEPGVSQGTANLLSELLSTDLAHSGRYEVLTSADVATLVGIERQKQLLSCGETNCAVELAQALGATLLLDASVGTVGNLRVLAIRLYDANKSKVLSRESVTVENESALVAAAHGALGRVLASQGAPLVPEVAAKHSPAGWYVLGGAAALAIAGGILGALAWTDYQAFKLSPFDDPLGSSAKGKAYAADGLFGGAIVAAVVAVVLLLLPASPGAPTP